MASLSSGWKQGSAIESHLVAPSDFDCSGQSNRCTPVAVIFLTTVVFLRPQGRTEISLQRVTLDSASQAHRMWKFVTSVWDESIGYRGGPHMRHGFDFPAPNNPWMHRSNLLVSRAIVTAQSVPNTTKKTTTSLDNDSNTGRSTSCCGDCRPECRHVRSGGSYDEGADYEQQYGHTVPWDVKWRLYQTLAAWGSKTPESGRGPPLQRVDLWKVPGCTKATSGNSSGMAHKVVNQGVTMDYAWPVLAHTCTSQCVDRLNWNIRAECIHEAAQSLDSTGSHTKPCGQCTSGAPMGLDSTGTKNGACCRRSWHRAGYDSTLHSQPAASGPHKSLPGVPCCHQLPDQKQKA